MQERRHCVIIYNGKLTDTLDSLQHQRFCENVASKSCHVKPQVSPPTSGAANTIATLYLQVQEWKGSADELNPTDWG